MSDNNDYNSGRFPEGSVTVSPTEAKSLAEQSRALAEAERNRTPLPRDRSVIPDEAFPPGFSAEQKRAYVDAMMAKDREYSNRSQDTVRHRDAQNARLPQVTADTVDPRSKGGSPRAMSQLQAGDTIAIAGTRVEVTHAERLGLIIRDAHGYRLASSTEQSDAQRIADSQVKADEQEKQEQQNDPEERFENQEQAIAAGAEMDAGTMNMVNMSLERLGADSFTALVNDYANSGSISLANIQEAARRAGMSNQDAQALVYGIHKGVEAQATKAAIAAGVPADAVNDLWGWAGAEHKAEHINAIRAIAVQGDHSGIRKLAKAFMTAARDLKRHRGGKG